MKKDPVKAVRFMLISIGILMVLIFIGTKLDNKETPEWFFPIFCLFCSISVIYEALKYIQKYIDELSALYRVIRQLQKRVESLEENQNIEQRPSTQPS